MSLVDSGIDLTDVNSRIDALILKLGANATALITARVRVAELRLVADTEAETAEQVRKLAGLFDTEVVQHQAGWQRENARLTATSKGLDELSIPAFTIPKVGERELDSNAALFTSVSDALAALETALTEIAAQTETAIVSARTAVAALRSQWNAHFEAFKLELDAKLEETEPGSSLVALRAHLAELQAKLETSRSAKEELDTQALPALTCVEQEREALLEELHTARRDRRQLRRDRVDELKAKTAGFVKLDIPQEGDFADFASALNVLKVGSRVRDTVIEAITRTVHPLKFSRSMLTSDFPSLVNPDNGIDAGSLARLYSNIDEKNLWQHLLAMQVIDRPDTLTVKFKKPDEGTYADIEDLAHGQRCTAILVVLLADGQTPVLVDQPEDALHAPWIEEYLVDRLRSLRGTRQYVFATRSPGIVVSGDAEQIVTMRATAGHGEIEASGSLDRYDLNRLALRHLEGGPVPFDRRTRKLSVSMHPGA